MAPDVLEFNDVALLSRGVLNGGRLKLHKGGVIFKSTKTGIVDQVSGGDIASAQWMQVARGYELKINSRNDSQFKFDGFKESNFDQLSEFLLKHFKVDLKEVELSVKGWNWGTANFAGSSLSFEVDSKPAFEIPLKDVSQATTGKNEVTLEFHQHDDAEVSLMEMRFFIPGGDGSEDPVQTFHESVVSKADIIQVTGDALVTIPDVACLTPRGRYVMKVYPTFLQLHGKTYDYKIPYPTILRLFLLPHKDQRFMFFVVSMDPPIKQGQTRYPFLITQFGKDEEIDVKLQLTEDELKEKYEDKISQEMSGPIYEIVSRLMKAVVGRKITVPGTFKSHSNWRCITCSYKAGSGMLYPLERGFIFVHKPPVHVRFDEISFVNFARVAGGGGSSRSFDFELETKSGTKYVFSSIEKEEYGKLFDFVRAKNLRIKNTGKNKAKSYDDDLNDSDDDQHDAYLEKMKAEGAEKYDDSDSDEGDSEDEDFNPENQNSEDDDVKEEYDSDASSSESEAESATSDDDERRKKKSSSSSHKKSEPKKRKADKPEKSTPAKKKLKTEKPESSKGKRKTKAKKDPNAPKRAMSAYMLWLADTRQQIKDENPGISVTDLSKRAGEMWKTLTDKSKWEKKAAVEKEKYQEAMKNYKAKQKEEQESPISKKKETSKSPKKSPKKAAGAFKSAEFVNTDDDSSSSEADTKKSKPSSKKKAKKEPESDESDAVKSSEEEDDEDEEMSSGDD